jgi:histo-blood group ABO system transferase
VNANQPSVAIVVIATGRYHEFLPALIEGAKAHVQGLERIFVLSDSAPHPDGVVMWLPWGHIPWPYPTLLRYRAMTAYREVLSAFEMLLYLDVDMRFQRKITIPSMEGTFAVRHPGYLGVGPDELPYERRLESVSHVSFGKGTSYFAGGVQGGSSVAYLDACATMADWIQTDLSNRLIPLWHDESVWNRYCITHEPELILSHTYCSPEYHKQVDAIIVALSKNHDRLREATLLTQIWRRIRRLTLRVARRAVASLRSSQ